MVDLVHYLTSLLIFDIALLNYYIYLRPLIICCLFSGDVYISLGISLCSPIFSSSFVTVSELFCGEVFATFVILSAIFLPIKSPVASAVFSITLFEADLIASLADCLA